FCYTLTFKLRDHENFIKHHQRLGSLKNSRRQPAKSISYRPQFKQKHLVQQKKIRLLIITFKHSDMRTLSNIIRGYGLSKTVGRSEPREFLMQSNPNRNISFNRRRYAH